MNHERMATDPEYFRMNVRIEHDGNFVNFVPDDWQEADFLALDPAWKFCIRVGPEPEIRAAWLERPRGHSKTSDMAMMVVWALRYSRRRIRGIAAAGDRDQAGFIRNSIQSIIDANPFLKSESRKLLKSTRVTYSPGLVVKGNEVINPVTGSTMEIISSDAKTSFGAKPDFLIVDEPTHWEDSASDFWDSLFSAWGKTGHSVLVAICNAGFTEHFAYKLHEKFQADPEWHFSHLNGPRASWITPKRLAAQERGLSVQQFERLWLNVWSQGSGDAIPYQYIKAAVKENLTPMSGAEPGWVFFGGVDLGLKTDLSAVCIVGKHTYGRLRLAALEAWQAPRGGSMPFMAIRDRISQLHKQYRAVFNYDVYQAGMMVEELTRLGVWLEPVPFQGQAAMEMATAIRDAFTSHNIDLYPDEALIEDLKRLRIEERPGGFRIVAERTSVGHCDRATALCMALLAAKRCPGVGALPGEELIDAFREEREAKPQGQAAHERLRRDYGMSRRSSPTFGPAARQEFDDDEESHGSGWERGGF